MTDAINAVSNSSFLSAGFDPHALTPDSMMVYLQTRMGGLDQQIDNVFATQEKSEKVRAALAEMQRLISSLDDKAENGTMDAGGQPSTTEPGAVEKSTVQKLNDQIAIIRKENEHLAANIESTLVGEGGILRGKDGNHYDNNYKGTEVAYTRTFLNDVGKQLEATAQMNMIRLQSLMSSRQTAVQLATNIIASYADSQKAIASNVR